MDRETAVTGVMIVRRHAWLVLLAALMLLFAACGDDDGGLGGGLLEDAIEREAGGDVNVDISGDEDDFTIEFQDEQGGGVISGGDDIPDGFPMPLPDNYVGLGSTAFEGDGERTVSVILEIPGSDLDKVIALYEGWLASRGVDADTMRISSEGTSLITIGGEADGETYGVTISSDASETVVSLIWMSGG